MIVVSGVAPSSPSLCRNVIRWCGWYCLYISVRVCLYLDWLLMFVLSVMWVYICLVLCVISSVCVCMYVWIYIYKSSG